MISRMAVFWRFTIKGSETRDNYCKIGKCLYSVLKYDGNKSLISGKEQITLCKLKRTKLYK